MLDPTKMSWYVTRATVPVSLGWHVETHASSGHKRQVFVAEMVGLVDAQVCLLNMRYRVVCQGDNCKVWKPAALMEDGGVRRWHNT